MLDKRTLLSMYAVSALFGQGLAIPPERHSESTPYYGNPSMITSKERQKRKKKAKIANQSRKRNRRK